MGLLVWEMMMLWRMCCHGNCLFPLPQMITLMGEGTEDRTRETNCSPDYSIETSDNRGGWVGLGQEHKMSPAFCTHLDGLIN